MSGDDTEDIPPGIFSSGSLLTGIRTDVGDFGGLAHRSSAWSAPALSAEEIAGRIGGRSGTGTPPLIKKM